MTYSVPGVYVEEISIFPPSVAQVETAIPAFVGYTEMALDANGNSLQNVPTRIGSLREFQQFFGLGKPPDIEEINLDADKNFVSAKLTISHYMYDALRLFYTNGGGDCYITSIGEGFGAPAVGDFEIGLEAVGKVDEPTILLFPDAASMPVPASPPASPPAPSAILYAVQQEALQQCGELMDRVTICDLEANDPTGANFRDKIGINDLKYGMAYTPWLQTG